MNAEEVSGGAGDASRALAQGEVEAPEEGGGQSHAFLKALQFDLVVDQLARYLNFEDMKALSATTKKSLNAIRKTKAFSDKARFIINKEVISSGLLKECFYLWKHISLDIAIPVEVVDLIVEVLDQVQSITLYISGAATLLDSYVVNYLGEIFRKTKELCELELDVAILNNILHDVFSSVEVQEIFGNLETLNIHGFGINPESPYYLDPSAANGEDEDTPFQRNFLQISQLPLKLKKFLIGKIVPTSASNSNEDPFKFIPKIVETTKDTLEELELHLNIWKREEMKLIRCPKLKRLTLSAEAVDYKIVETFLMNQPHLEELVLEMKKEFPVRLLMCLQGLVSKMRKLRLKVKRFADTSEAVDWKFLESMTKLEEFTLRRPFSKNFTHDIADKYGHGDEIISKLPGSIKKISILGLEDEFWTDSGEADGLVNNIGEYLIRFANLTELNLFRCQSAINDAGMQTIIKSCSNLTALSFSHCYELTDFGISGVAIRMNEGEHDWEVVGNADEEDPEIPAENNSGKPLSDLKGLRTLRIRSCPNVTPECLLNVVRFNYLQTFDYYKNVQLSKEFLLQIVRQNPCLEKVSLHITSYENDAEYLKELKEKVKDINPRVHLIEIMEQTNWEEEDTDSDASSWNEGGDGDSDFSGFGHDHLDYDDDYYDSPGVYDDDDYDDDNGFDLY